MTQENWIAEARKLYDKPDRFYHTWDHILSCLSLLMDLGDKILFSDYLLLRSALIYHDAIYDTHAKDSEDQSARLAIEDLTVRTTMRPDDIAEVARLITLTKEHNPATDDYLGQIMCDVDCAILGASYVNYVEYVSGVRKEYGWVSDEDWKVGRSTVLTNFLARPRIYRSGYFDHLEEIARQNMTKELELLQ